MKKLRLLFALLALTLGVTTVSAQKDVTAQYITNATLSSLNGWTNVNFNTPVRGNNTTGYATECYEGWSSVEKSEYSLTQKITLPKGHYTLVNYSFFREGQNFDTDASKSRAYLKAGSNQVLVKTLGSITAAGYANSQAEGANCFDSKMYRNTLDFTIDEDNTEIEIGVNGTFNTDITKSWMILGMFELIDNDQLATMDSPFDVTGYMTNPGFEYRDMTGWTLSEEGAIGTHNGDQTWKVGGYFAEKWQQTGAWSARSISQTLKSLPAGLYRLSANLGGDGTYIDLNGKTVKCTADGDYTTSYVLAKDEDLTIKAGKDDDGSANWIHFDNFKLYFCGDVAAALTTLLGEVSDYEGKIPSDAYSALQMNVATYDKNYSDPDELLAAIDAVQALYDDADLLKAPFADFKALKEKADVLAGVNNDNSEANETLDDAISTAVSDIETKTSVNDIETVTSTLKVAMVAYVGEANPVGENAKFDCTFMLTNPDLTGLPKEKAADGWYTDQDGGNSQVMTNESVAGTHGNAFYEYWSGTAAANDKFTLYQKVNLPAGTFTINCDAFASPNGVSGATTSAVYFFANDTQGSLVANATLTASEISFVNVEEQEVKIGLKALSGNQYRWMGIGYVELYKVPAVEVSIDERVTYVPEAVAGKVTLTRTLSTENWNTFVVPFQINNEELKTAFGEGVLVAEYSETADGNNSTVEFNKMTTPAISPNVPVLLQPANVATDNIYVFENRTVATGNAVKAGTNFDFVGTYAATTTIAEGDYFISRNQLWKSTGATAIKGTRAYIKAKNSEAKVNLFIDGIATSIREINGATANESGDIFNIVGQRVKKAQKGLYIINGKKVLVK